MRQKVQVRNQTTNYEFRQRDYFQMSSVVRIVANQPMNHH